MQATRAESAVRPDLSVVSDEISRDFVTAAEFAQKMDISVLELRNLRTGRFPFVAPEEFAEVEKYAGVHGITFRTISPGLCKQELDPDTDIGALQTLNRNLFLSAMEGAHKVGAHNIVSFGFRRPKNRPGHDRLPGWCVEFMHECAERAYADGLRILLENHSSCYVATTDHLIELCEKIDSPGLGINWDLYNSWVHGRGFVPADWMKLAPRLGQIHLKDGRRGALDFERTVLGEGELEWRDVLSAHAGAAAIGLVIETHRRPRMRHVTEDILALTTLIAGLEEKVDG